MKTIGLIGGMSWQSSIEYYRLINEDVSQRLGGSHSARCLMASVDFAEIGRLQHDGDWKALGEIMAGTARKLEQGGADFIVLCTNTMHKLAGDIEHAVKIPLLHIVDATATEIGKVGLSKVGLLGTAFTMEQAFYKGRLGKKFGVEVLVPDDQGRETVHSVIYSELVKGVIRDASRERYRQVIGQLVEEGAEAIILGCTEIGLLIKQEDCPVPLFDTTAIHARAAVDRALT